MHLFILSQAPIKNEETLLVNEKNLIHQRKNVLRYKPWSKVSLQLDNKRFVCEVVSLAEKASLKVVEEITRPSFSQDKVCLHIAFPNKRDKAEMIVQKCTEIWVDEIHFWKAEKSQLDLPSSAKQERIQQIAHEAAEQSRWWHVPTISYEKQLVCQQENKVILFQWGEKIGNNFSFKWWVDFIVWPEWGFSEKELAHFAIWGYSFVSLWETILRMETAAIVWSRAIKNFEITN